MTADERTDMTERDEHVVLMAFVIEGEAGARAEAQQYLQARVHPLLQSQDHSSRMISWWVAEDDRNDGSDNDSAVFVRTGCQNAASRLLHAAGLTFDYNVAEPEGGQFSPDGEEDTFEGALGQVLMSEHATQVIHRAVTILDSEDTKRIADLEDAIRGIVSAWEGGDLAGAVNAAREVLPEEEV